MKKIIILFIFILIFKIDIIKSQLYFEDVTIDKDENFKYSSSECTFTFVYLVRDLSSTNIQNLEVKSNDALCNQYVNSINRFQISNDTSSLFEINLIVLDHGVYNHTFIINNTIDSIPFYINYQCENIPDGIEYKELNVRGMELDVFGKFSTIFRYQFKNGTQLKSFVKKSQESNYCDSTQLKNQNLVKVDLNLDEDFDVTKVYVEFHSVQGISFYYPNTDIIFRGNDEVTNLEIYPHSLDINQVTPYTKPLFTFISNQTNTYKSLYFQIPNTFPTTNYFYRPMSSIGNKTKYISGLRSQSINFFSQNYGNFQESFNVSVLVRENDNWPLDTIGVVDDSLINSFTVSFNSTYTHGFELYKIEFYNSIETKFPFGFVSGSLYDFNYKISLVNEPIVQYKKLFSIYNNIGSFFQLGFTLAVKNVLNDSTNPVYEDIQYIHLKENLFLLRIKITYKYEIYKWSIDSNKDNYAEKLIEGSLSNGTFDFVINAFNPIDHVAIQNNIGYLEIGSFYQINNLKYFKFPSFNKKNFNYNDLSFIKLLYPVLNVTNQNQGNILFFNFTQEVNIDTPISLLLYNPVEYFTSVPEINNYPTENLFPSTWNNSVKLFQIEFFVKSNSHPGTIPYALFLDCNNFILNSLLPDHAQINIISMNQDLYGPIFDNFTCFPVKIPIFTHKQKLMSSINSTIFGWSFNIIDEVNGFSNGYITVRARNDGSLYNFTLTPNDAIEGDKYNGKYRIEIALNSTLCTLQRYIITDVYLVDEMGYNSTFSITNSFDSLSNPFINILNDSMVILVSSNDCIGNYDETGPKLLNFELLNPPTPAPNYQIDLGYNQNILEFNLTAQDLETGLNENQSPIIYLTTTNLRIHKCKNPIIEKVDNTTSNFIYSCEIPIGFGYPSGILFSVYTFINNGGSFSGYSSSDLSALGFRNGIVVEEMKYSLDYPSIEGCNKIKSNDNELWIYGRGFGNVSKVVLQFINNNPSPVSISKNKYNGLTKINHTKIVVQIEQNLLSSLKLVGLPRDLTPFNIEFTYGGNLVYLDPFTITPIENVQYIQQNLPINPDQKCMGTPECSGLNNGYCSKTGCICYSPYIGPDCSSKVIVIPQPTSNTDPSRTFEIPSDNDGKNGTDSIFKSFISFKSLREIDIYGNIVNEIIFEKWVYTKISNNTHIYQTNLSNSSTLTTQLQWFDQEGNVSFANQLIKMNPSTLKYTIDIDGYQFRSKLNSLELIISASIKSSKTDEICSSQQFGDTSDDDNSNYMKLQVDNHSLYGRFIKRGIYDYIQIRSLSNRLLDDNEKKNNHYSSNTLIGISMSYFDKHVTIDPDFSTLLDHSPASNDSENSICSDSKKKLSTSQLVGIIIGCFAFVAVLISCISYYIIKKRQKKKFVSNIQNKLKQMK